MEQRINYATFQSWFTNIKNDFYGFTGLLFFFYFFIISIVFYKECMASQDYSWELTYFLNKEGFNLVYFRWGSLPWRLFLIIAPYVGLSLKSALILTSFWFVFLKFITWAISHYYFKNPLAGILIISSILLSYSKGYYAHGWQLYNATLYFCLLYTVLLDKDKMIISKNWLRIFVIAALIVLIKWTYAVTLILCPLIILLALKKVKHKLLFLAAFGVFSIISLAFFNPPYEENILNSILTGFKTKKFSDMLGVFIFLLKEFFDLNYLIPLCFYIASVYILYKKRKYLSILIIFFYLTAFFFLAIFKLATWNANYPLSSDIEYYLQGTFYSMTLLIMAIFLYLVYKYFADIINNTASKIIFLFLILFYTSGITTEGIKQYEYNIYINSLITDLNNTYEESFFVIDESYIPYRYSKLNINIDYETLIKSNIHINESIILYITPYTTPLTIDNEYPVFINTLSCFEHNNEINLKREIDLATQVDSVSNETLFFFKQINPHTSFINYNPDYFHFKNYEYRIINKSYMDSFNKRYGFSISEY
jgi:hypothetical protein